MEYHHRPLQTAMVYPQNIVKDQEPTRGEPRLALSKRPCAIQLRLGHSMVTGRTERIDDISLSWLFPSRGFDNDNDKLS
jgi:hypothetical protein